MTHGRTTLLTMALTLALAAALGCETKVTDRGPSGSGTGIPVMAVDVQPPFAATGVAPTTDVRVTFSKRVRPATVNASSFVLRELPAATPVAGTLALNILATEAVFVPDAPLGLGVTYELTLTKSILDESGSALFVMAIVIPIPSTFTVTAMPDPAPPNFGGVVTATAASEEAIFLAWAAAMDAQATPAEITYAVYDASATGGQDFGNPLLVTEPGAVTDLLTGLLPSSDHFIVVRARDLHGNEDNNTVEMSATTAAAPDTTAPFFAGLTTTQPSGPTEVLLSWSPAIDNIDPAGQMRYRVFVEEAAGLQTYLTPILETPAGATGAVVGGLAPGRHFFAVRSVDTSGNTDANPIELSGVTMMSYRRSIQPVHLVMCATSGCHTSTDIAGGLSLETYAEFQSGGISGTPYAVGMPDISLVVRRVDDTSPQFIPPLMPQGGARLPDRDVVILEEWIRQGAVDN